MTKLEQYKDWIFELSGPEGVAFEKIEVTAVKSFGLWPADGFLRYASGGPIRFYVQVVGFYDDIAPQRNWGESIKEPAVLSEKTEHEIPFSKDRDKTL